MAPMTAPISTHVAGGLTVIFALIYVAPFYLSPTLRSSPLASRNTPSVIKARTRAVFLSCIASVLITIYVLHYNSNDLTISKILHLFGIFPINVLDIFNSCLLLAILFAGPLFEKGIVEGGIRYWGSLSCIKQTVWDDWIGWRNLVVGPTSEELVFRSLTISLCLLAQASALHITFTSPLIFGVAHLHHLHEWITAHRQSGESYLNTALTPSIILPGVFRSIFQFLYTSLFGFIAAFIYLRTGSVWSCILAHTFCNWMGLPRFWGRVGEEIGEEVSGEDEHEHVNAAAAFQAGKPGQVLSVSWTVAYYILLVGGAIGFWKFRWSLTTSDNALIRF